MKKIIVCIILLLFALNIKAEVVLPRILGHGMVLQRDRPVPIWGTAAAGEQITVQFAGQEKKTVTEADGNWKVFLNPLKASNKLSSLVITGANTIKLDNILVGEVWLCSGQSNMEYTMRKNSKIKKPDVAGQNPVDELEYANNHEIRIFLVNRKELVKPDPDHKGWSIARDSALRSFSAAGYFFAKELNAKLGVPVGMISSAVPGSAIEPWIPVNGFTSEFFNNKRIGGDPGKFYDPMIVPLAPFAVKGFLWYQGETNCFQNETIEYTYKMEALINSWRRLWNDSDLPFYYVQIAPYYYSKSAGKYPLTKETLPKFWEAQQLAMKIPHTGMTVTTDLINTPDDLHPGFKWEVGRRLAQWPLAIDYGSKINPSGPVYNKMRIKGDKIKLRFRYTGKGLTSNDGMALSQFEIAGADGEYHPAKAEIKGKKVIVSSAEVKHPANVHFAWNEGGKANFCNKDGLPAMPFRTNNPLINQYKYTEANYD